MKIRENTADEELLYIIAEDETERRTIDKYYKEGGAIVSACASMGGGEIMINPPSKSGQFGFFVNKEELIMIACALNSYSFQDKKDTTRIKLIRRILNKLGGE